MGKNAPFISRYKITAFFAHTRAYFIILCVKIDTCAKKVRKNVPAQHKFAILAGKVTAMYSNATVVVSGKVRVKCGYCVRKVRVLCGYCVGKVRVLCGN